MRREYPEAPLVGVAAVVIQGDKVLLVQRGQEPHKGSWGLPGGLVQLGESVSEAVRREVAEETALEIEPGEVLGVFEPIVWDEQGRIRFHYVVIDFLARPLGGILSPASDVTAARWVSPQELASYQVRAETAEVIRKAWAIAVRSRDPMSR
jgi:8-oxo-dGTP diphosphatase